MVEINWEYYSSKNLEKYTHTRSLNKLEELITKELEDKGIELSKILDLNNYQNDNNFLLSVGAYVFYNKIYNVNPYKHPILWSSMSKYESSLEEVALNNSYTRIRRDLEKMAMKKENSIKHKKWAREFMVTVLERQKDLNIKKLSDCLGIPYSNIYKFIKQSEDSSLSLERVEIVIEFLREYEIKINDELFNWK